MQHEGRDAFASSMGSQSLEVSKTFQFVYLQSMVVMQTERHLVVFSYF
jgi:hypothetical protein